MLDFKIIAIAIGRSYADAYRFLADARNFSAWGGGDPGAAVTGLGGNDWLVQVDSNKLVLRYSNPNSYGILDYKAFRPGEEPGFATPVRLYRNLDGCELTFTYFHRPGLSEGQFASGAEWLESYLLRLKTVLEKDRPPRLMFISRIISLSIERPVKDVFRFLIEPRNFMQWASVTGLRFEHLGGRDWLADTAAGPRIIRFIEPNDYGVVDHAVFPEDEAPVFGPMRVVANGEGTLLVYTFFRRPGLSDEKFESTVEWITTDLMMLKTVLEV
ncbi:MAG: hypothetical protein ACYCZU_07895 [Devosia sp.]